MKSYLYFGIGGTLLGWIVGVHQTQAFLQSLRDSKYADANWPMENILLGHLILFMPLGTVAGFFLRFLLGPFFRLFCGGRVSGNL